MCDSANTTDIVESECWLCPDQYTCNLFSSSYINRCNWRAIQDTDGNRCDDSGKCDGICTDGLDYIQVGASPGFAVVGWMLVVFGIGWGRKDRGKFGTLRRHGYRVTAVVLSRFIDSVAVPTAEGLPELPVTRYWAKVSWKPRPPPQATWLGMFLHPRWGPWSRPLKRGCQCWLRCCPCCSCCLPRHARVHKHGGKLKPWQRVLKEDGTVQLAVQLQKSEWERARLTNGLLSTLRIVYDPYDDTNWVLPETAMGEGVNRAMPLAITVCMGVALVCMSCIMIIDGFHCGPHFWGFHECCDDCADWQTVATVPELMQQCYRGGCDGLAGKSHVYWCGNERNGESCYIGWSMVPIPAAVAAVALAVVVVLQKNKGICRPGSKWDRFCGYVCGEGLFCCPDEPPRMYKRLPFELGPRSVGGSAHLQLLDYTNASGHL